MSNTDEHIIWFWDSDNVHEMESYLIDVTDTTREQRKALLELFNTRGAVRRTLFVQDTHPTPAGLTEDGTPDPDTDPLRHWTAHIHPVEAEQIVHLLTPRQLLRIASQHTHDARALAIWTTAIEQLGGIDHVVERCAQE